MSNPSDLLTVLYVEDDALTQATVEEALQEAGYAVLLASNGAEGLEILSARKAELLGLITDVNLGDGPDGWEVARHARELRPDLPVVYVSGKDSQEWTSQGVPHSVMISKPFAPAQVVVAISWLLNAHDQQS